MIYFLVGFMGCGKSTIARELSRRTGIPFFDTDKEIEKLEGRTVGEIFASHGQEYFRQKERQVLHRLIEPGLPRIIATGGGLPCHDDNMALMNSAGQTIYLKMSPGKLCRRVNPESDKRPLIKGMNPEQLFGFISENLSRREHFYNLSDLVIDCDGVSDHYICEHIVSHMGYLED